MEIKLTEKEVEDYIFEKNGLEDYSIKCVGRQVQMGDAGIVDILGWDRESKTWVIVEIKRDGLDAKAYAQAERYRSWLHEYMDVRSAGRCKPFNPPYTLLIGGELADDLRFLKDLTDNDTRSAMNGFYLFYNVSPTVHLGRYVSKKARQYQEKTLVDIEGRTQ